MKFTPMLILWCGLGCLAQPLAAEGVVNPEVPSKVVRLGKNKKGPFVVFNHGSLSGFVIGRDVCLYNESGEKLTCSVIIRTKPRAAAIQVSEEDRAKITLGNLVWPADLGDPPKASHANNVELPKENSDISSVTTEEDDPPEPILPPVLSSRAQVHLAPTVALPIWMNDLRFNAAARVTGTGSIWESGDTIKGSVIGFGARYYIPKNGQHDSAWDFTYHFVPQRPVKDDFDLTDGSTSVLSSVWSHHYRLRYLRGASVFHRDTYDLLLYTGVGYDFMRTLFKSTLTGGATNELVSGTITGHGLEIPVVLTWQQYIGGWMLVAGMDMALPIGVFGESSKGKLSYVENVGDAKNTLTTAVEAVNVRRGWFAMALQLGVGAKF